MRYHTLAIKMFAALYVCGGLFMAQSAWALTPIPMSQQSNANITSQAHQSVVPSVDSPRCEGAWMPLATFQQLTKAAAHRIKHPKIHWARVGEARYKAELAEGGLQVQAELNIESKGAGWHRVGVLPAHYPLHQATIDGRPALILSSADAPQSNLRQLAFQGEKRFVLRLRFFLPLLVGPDPQVQLAFAPSTASSLEVFYKGPGYRPRLRQGLHTRIQHHTQGTTLRAFLQPGTQPLLEWWQATESSQATKKKLQRAARLYANTYALLSTGQGGQELFLTFRYTIVHAPREQFKIFVPKGIHIRQVHGLGIRDYRLIPDKSGKGQILDVLLIEPVTERYELSLLAEQRKDIGNIALRLPAPLGIQRETGYLGVEVTGNDALTIEPKGATNIDVQELPVEIIRGTRRPILRAYRFTRRPVMWRLHVHRHKNVSVPAAIIDQAMYLHVSNQRGHTWIQASYQVRNTFKQFIAISLPKGAQIQSTFVDGKPVKPAQDPKGRVLVPLKRSGKASGNAFSVEVVYSLKHRPFQRRRQHRISLPKVDLWISALNWRLYLPEGKVEWFKPTLGHEQPRGYSNWSLNQNESQSRGSRSRYNRGRHHWRSQSVRTIVSANQIQFQNDGKVSGILPVRIHLPQRGRLYIFHRHHLSPLQATQLHFVHQPPLVGTLGIALFLLSGLMAGFALTLMSLRNLWGSWLLWSLLLGSFGLGIFAHQLALLLHLTLYTAGAFGGMVLAGITQIFLKWDKKAS